MCRAADTPRTSCRTRRPPRGSLKNPTRHVHILIGQKARVHPQPVVLEVGRRGQRGPSLLVQRSRNIADFGAVGVALYPRRIDCDRDDIVLGHCVGVGLHFQAPVAPAGAAIVVLPVRVQLLYVFHRCVENLRCFFQRLCRITERHAIGRPDVTCSPCGSGLCGALNV